MFHRSTKGDRDLLAMLLSEVYEEQYKVECRDEIIHSLKCLLCVVFQTFPSLFLVECLHDLFYPSLFYEISIRQNEREECENVKRSILEKFVIRPLLTRRRLFFSIS